MADVDVFTGKLAELLRAPDDLDKIPALKAEFTRKKAVVDSQLSVGLKEQLEVTQSGMGAINESQRIVNQIKEEMMKIDKLCAESQGMIRDFPHLNEVSTIHRNISLVETTRNNITRFPERVDDVRQALEADEVDLDNQPRLLSIHRELTQLREIRDDSMDQIRQSPDESLEGNLQQYFQDLDEYVGRFDERIFGACERLAELVREDNHSLVVRLALIIEEEEKRDLKVKAMQDAQKEHKAMASRFKSMKTGPKQIRGYKERFLAAIEETALRQFENSEDKFLENPEKLEKTLKWYFNDLNTVKIGMVGLMPKKWKIYKTYTSIYHQAMHDWLKKFIDEPGMAQLYLLVIVRWREKYYEKMGRLGWSSADLQPDLLDEREGELIRGYRDLLVSKMNEWMDRMFETDEKAFRARLEDATEKDSNGYFRTKTLPDMWRMLREQTTIAGDSGRLDVTEGVLDAMFRALKGRQRSWTSVVTDETSKYTRPGADTEGIGSLQDFLIATANDQISCIDDSEDQSQISYLTRFKNDFTAIVPASYAQNSILEVSTIRDNYIDLATVCMKAFTSLIFAIDLRSTLADFFTAKWYTEYGMKRITSTFEDYAADYSDVIHNSLFDILLEELSEKLLSHYLGAVRNKGAKFRRADPFTEKIADDVRTAWAFFEKYPTLDFGVVKGKWRAVHHMVRLLEVDKVGVPGAYEACKREFWDVQLGWVESVLRARDDYERSMLSGVKARAAEVYVERGVETVMSQVK
ncbi:SNARE-binding exocyst subunit S6 [Thelotrema lepadinum]|nr:SNARE-binding exocyst subunit S6 [Thelotrema lepadinum]